MERPAEIDTNMIFDIKYFIMQIFSEWFGIEKPAKADTNIIFDIYFFLL